MNKTIIVAGATGLIGKKLVNELCKQGAFIKIISTNAETARKIFKDILTIQAFNWSDYDTSSELSRLIENSDAVINLAGANVGEARWTKDYKTEIYESRIEITSLIVDAISHCTKAPECLINASAVGYYGFRGEEQLEEEAGPGDDFLAKVCRDWELEANKATESGVRVVTIRAGIVLDKNQGALKSFLSPFKFSIGTYMGNGKQWLPWIHIEDLVNLYIFALDNNNLTGAVNAVAPDQVTNKQFVKTMGIVLRTKILLPVPKLALKIGLGEFADNLLTGQKVCPGKIFKQGFSFRFPDLKPALENLLNKK